MAEVSGMSKAAGRAGLLLAAVGFFLFMAGIFGPARSVMFVGIALIALSLAAFFIEEYGPRGVSRYQ